MKALAILAALLIAAPAMGFVDVGIDFNQTGAVSSQGGIFNDFNLASSGNGSLPLSQTNTINVGTFTTKIIGGATFTGNFNAGGFVNSGAFTYANMLNDFAYAGFDPGTLDVEISGNLIQPNTAYPLTVWAVDHNGTNNNQTETVSAIAGTTGIAGASIAHGGSVTAPTSNSDYSTTVIFTSSASGTLTFSVLAGTAGSQFSERVNGFTVGGLPEPTGAALLLAVAPLVARRKRQA